MIIFTMFIIRIIYFNVLGSLKELGLPLLCCRGSHRKLERALWMARSRAEAMMANTDEEDDDRPFDPQQVYSF